MKNNQSCNDLLPQIKLSLEKYITALCQDSNLYVHLHIMFPITPYTDFFDVSLNYRSHTSPICLYVKNQENGLARCIQNKKNSIKKALQYETPYLYECYRGLNEIVIPVYHKNNPMCILYVGNIIKESILHKLSFDPTNELLKTVAIAKNDDFTSFIELSHLIADIIRLNFEKLDTEHKLNIPQKPHWAMAQALDHIQLNYNCDITLKDIAEVCFFNEQYLSRLFKKQFGCTFTEYLNTYRLEISKKLLSDTTASIMDISQQVGYNNVTYFNRCFKKAFDISPTYYRKSPDIHPK